MGTQSHISQLNTWTHFHHEAFGHQRPPLPLLPITVRSLVMIGALLKAGDIRLILVMCHTSEARTSRPGTNGANYYSTLPHGLHAQYSGALGWIGNLARLTFAAFAAFLARLLRWSQTVPATLCTCLFLRPCSCFAKLRSRLHASRLRFLH